MTKTALPRFVTYRADVVGVRHLGPRFVRVTFGGTGLSDFTVAGVSPKIKVYIPAGHPMTNGAPSFDTLLDGAAVRTYTVRAFRPEVGEIDIDFVIHNSGPAGRWASQASVGQVLAVSNAAGYPPLDAERVLLVGDPSSLPAIMTVLEALPGHAVARVLLRVDDQHEQFKLEGPAIGITRWVETGTDTEALTEIVLQEIADFHPEYVWAAGEAGTLKPLRRQLRGASGYTKETSHIVGYWRRHSTADRYDSEIVAKAKALVQEGVPLTPQDMDELSVDASDASDAADMGER